ncbi:XAC2610-related protein [Burkholderia ubonensis]|uniref:XAC2610-related protein n=1 Tax=Burkholderia ubonensis TaxID=101571 RepID=UPI0012F7F059|nr:nitrite reductase [Burkholderia ubonensis]
MQSPICKGDKLEPGCEVTGGFLWAIFMGEPFAREGVRQIFMQSFLSLPVRRALLVLWFCFISFHSALCLAEENAGVELTYWTRSFSGTIAGKRVKADLEAVGGHVSGSYCYEPCGKSGLSRIQLEGRQQMDNVELSETAYNKKSEQIVSGKWALVLQRTSGQGIWSSPDGKKSWSITLIETNSGKYPFPFEIRLLASAEPTYGDSRCSDPPLISEIRLYKNSRLVQTLPTASQGTCSMFLPEIVDINFDGYPDLMLAQTLPAGPNIPYDYWVYDPAQGKMVSVSDEMASVTSPDLDPVNKIISVSWRASCCEHGVTTYRWKGKHLIEIDTAPSYFQPEIIDGKLAICYITPAYQRNGRIEYPNAVYQHGATLRTTPLKLADCSDVSSHDLPGLQGRVEIQIWSGDSSPAKLVRTERLRWKKTPVAGGKTMYCPDIPVFNHGAVKRHLLKAPDQCSDTPVE